MGKRYTTKQSLFAFGPHQTNFQTMDGTANASTSPAKWRFLVKEGYDKVAFSSPNVNNAGESTGYALPDKTYKDRDEATFSAAEQLTFQLLGIRANDAFGVTATPTVVVASHVWKHVFSLLDPFTSASLPTRPLVQKVSEPVVSGNRILDQLFPSMTFSSLSVTDTGQKPNLLLTSSWQGSGQNTVPSGVQFYGSGKQVLGTGTGEINEDAINKRSGVVTIFPEQDFGGTAVATNCLSRGFTFTLNENLNVDGGYAGCGLFQDGDASLGAIAGSLDSNGQTVTVEVTLVADSDVLQSFDINTRLKAGTICSLKNVYTGGLISAGSGNHHYASFNFSKLVISSAEWVDVDGGSQGIRLVFDPLASGNLVPVSLELQTNVADFNAYIGA